MLLGRGKVLQQVYDPSDWKVERQGKDLIFTHEDEDNYFKMIGSINSAPGKNKPGSPIAALVAVVIAFQPAVYFLTTGWWL